MKGKVKQGPLNVRAVPSTDGMKLGKLQKGEIIEIVVPGDWMRIIFKGDPEAWVAGKFIEKLTRQGKITASSLNVRNQPNGDKIGSVKRNTVIEINDEVDGWIEFDYNGREAFVSAKYVKDLDDVDDVAEEESGDSKTFLWQNPQLRKVEIAPAKKVEELSYKAARSQRLPRVIWNKYGNLLTVLSKQYKVEVASSVAFLAVESGGEGFGPGNKMLIRFENHWFWNLWGKKNAETFNKFFKYSSGAKWKGHQISPKGDGNWINFHGKQNKEWEALELARSFDNDAALNSISMGAPQIMGFNYKKIGYNNVQEMFDHFNKDIRYHILGLFDFFDDNMIRNMRNHDFVACARGYNGPGQAKQYGKWIKEFYDAFPNV